MMTWRGVVEDVARQSGIQQRQIASAREWVGLIENVAAMADDPEKKASEVLDRLVRETRYLEWLEKEEGEESIESSHAANVRELIRVAEQFGSVAELLDYVDRTVEEATRQRRSRRSTQACVTLMTIHRSKGLEWPVVWVVGCNESILPHAKGDLEEERRLMYVAATRARDHLIVSHVTELATRAGLKTVDRSQFLEGVVADPPLREPAQSSLLQEVAQ